MNSLPIIDLRSDTERAAHESRERTARAVALLAKVDRQLMAETMDALWAARFRTRRPVEQLTDAQWFAELDESEEA